MHILKEHMYKIGLQTGFKTPTVRESLTVRGKRFHSWKMFNHHWIFNLDSEKESLSKGFEGPGGSQKI